MSDPDRPWNDSRSGPGAHEPADDGESSGLFTRRTVAVTTGIGGLLVVVAGVAMLAFVSSIGCGCPQTTPQLTSSPP